MQYKPCVLIPVYNHPTTVKPLLQAISLYALPVVLVDDGSEESCRIVLQDLAREFESVHLLVLKQNRGKGGAVKAGLQEAQRLGFSHAVQIDADGQHKVEDIPDFIQHSQRNPTVLIAGKPIYDESIPKNRLYGRYLTHVWVWINTLSFQIEDSMCGFRVYPTEYSCQLIDKVFLGERMDFDTEFLVRWWWAGGHIEQRGTSVTYPQDGISHFNKLQDNWLISKMHTRLFFGMLLRLPKLIFRSPGKEQWKYG
ncbi:Polyprenol monophosphomannose synthase [Thalassocella blandensis]|nr:Polyprenol monophosphomannose synthase [Thalassocella blandensis]